MSALSLFATRIYCAPLLATDAAALNARLLAECRQLRKDDAAGRRWSVVGYPGGYTSYGTVNRMQEVSPSFAQLARHLARHVRAFANDLEFDLSHRRLTMTDCWVNIMPPGVAHGLHLHPVSTVSGTYYVRVPAGSPGLKFEDPRLDRMMAAPPRRAGASAEAGRWYTVPAKVGQVVLFESWLRHEVTANLARSQRISISFNYNWF